jgi:fatty acid desaturase
MRLIAPIVDSILSCMDSTKKMIFNYFPFEGYYKLMKMLKKYFDSIVKPSATWTFMISIIYVCVVFLFGWDIMPLVFFLIFIIFLIIYIVWGCLYGEDQKKFYKRDD